MGNGAALAQLLGGGDEGGRTVAEIDADHDAGAPDGIHALDREGDAPTDHKLFRWRDEAQIERPRPIVIGLGRGDGRRKAGRSGEPDAGQRRHLKIGDLGGQHRAGESRGARAQIQKRAEAVRRDGFGIRPLALHIETELIELPVPVLELRSRRPLAQPSLDGSGIALQIGEEIETCLVKKPVPGLGEEVIVPTRPVRAERLVDRPGRCKVACGDVDGMASTEASSFSRVAASSTPAICARQRSSSRVSPACFAAKE